MDKKILWLGFYLKEKNVLKTVKFFEENIPLEEILSYKKYKVKEIEILGLKEFEKAEKLGIKILFREDKEFPEKIKLIPYAPIFLYVKGNLEKISPSVGVIGSRRPTNYGKEVAYKFSKRLAEAGVVVVSGLARGIDTIAHKVCLEVEGKTIAILGSGLDVVYPPENKPLFDKISDGYGAVVSEFPFGTSPRKENFPTRNRLISGFSEAILVVEAGKRSGTLITAKWALNQGKEVFAVPGSIFSPQSEGTHFLIKSGAQPVFSPEELLEFLGVQEKDKIPNLFDFGQAEATQEKLTKEEKEVLSFLSSYPIHLEDLLLQTDLPASEVLSAITELEFKGIVQVLPGNFIKLKG
ncbi:MULTISPECIES: DNA-processing protein DprA [Thermodesulfobacterium]|jgi:DNA processing protein|uniref:DNA-processing protein DprA n=1 Tax=Thermodesulfobacterium TaxID=1740 RepID=UPI00068B4CE8|nr:MULTISPECIES: DNA-processing protein DprA [Thermodesulfobacterium]KUJ97612.1 MAG: DNA protecting protein DprA [Thermodesulfobacterium sp. 37_54]MBZ4680940.1 hypothetical protein [Thermodesulfobacterium sp.]